MAKLIDLKRVLDLLVFSGVRKWDLNTAIRPLKTQKLVKVLTQDRAIINKAKHQDPATTLSKQI